MITKSLIEKLFSATSIQRWNDLPRALEFTELDKQAHKMIFAYIIARLEEEQGGRPVDWLALVEGGIFEFFHRITLTDIKPAVFHRMMEKKERELNEWVIGKLEPEMQGLNGSFFRRFKEYLRRRQGYGKERLILKAAHYLATNWEFKIIYNIAPFIHGIGRIKADIEGEIERHTSLAGVRELLNNPRLFEFADRCGQLRFQLRWAQSPRIPKTYVLGHMLMVAILAYFCSLEMGITSRRRKLNNFFTGLFHDLPEVLTKDIVNPVKKSIPGLDALIKEYEHKQIHEEILPLLPSSWHKEISYFIGGEFKNKIVARGRAKSAGDPLPRRYDHDRFSPVDGGMIGICDKLSAFIEASLSIKYGIKTDALERGKRDSYDRYSGREVPGVRFKELFDYFK